jgi:hypothetical protein
MLEGMDLHFLMTFEDHEIVAVSLMITEEKVLAMGRIYFFPIFQSQLNGRKRRMGMKLIAEAMLFKEGKHLGDSFVFHYLLRLFAKWVGSDFFFCG